MNPKAIALGALALAAAGSTGAALWLAVSGSDDSPRKVDQVIGVQSGARGSNAAEPSQQGVRQVLPQPPAADRPAPAADAAAGDAAPQTIEGVRGAAGSPLPPRNAIESVRRESGSIEPINRQEGVTTLTLQNLEVVLRMQSRTPPPPPKGASQGGGTSAATTAAKLLILEKPEAPPEEEVSDDRAIDAQFRQQDQKGS
ncbi:MAG: hypothetical protein NTY19_10020 [Planctomycetota bacterium]|nr:hypothetical protein [Planctomycetota bacterium]